MSDTKTRQGLIAMAMGKPYRDVILSKPLSKILLAALFTAAVDYVAEANEERKRLKAQLASNASSTTMPSVSKTWVNANVNHKGEKTMDNENKEMEQQDERDVSGFGPGLLLGSLIGSVIGAGLALWYAPQTGKRTQAMLKREANHMQRQVSKKANTLYSAAEDMANEATERASHLTEQGREFVEEKANTLKKAVGR